MNKRDLKSVQHSIRTHFGFLTAGILLALLLVFYLGGRFILINIIRQAEKDITVVSNNIKSVITHQMNSLQSLTRQTANQYTALPATTSRSSFLQKTIQSNQSGLQTQIAAILNPNGSLREGYYSLHENLPVAIEPHMLSRYFNTDNSLEKLLQKKQMLTGVINFQKIPHYVAISPVFNNENEIESILIIGSVIHETKLFKKMAEISHGLSVFLNDSATTESDSKKRSRIASVTLAPIFGKNQIFSAGSQWHVGDNEFETVIPIYDILGDEISSLSIKFPRNFFSLTTIALGSLTVFVAIVGIIFIVPIFWLQSRILLDPLSKLERQIKNISTKHKENKIKYLNYDTNDEFGRVARSVDNLLQELNSRSQQIFYSAQRQKALITSIPDCLCIFSKSKALISIEKQPDNATPIPGFEKNQPLSPAIFKDESLVMFHNALQSSFEIGETQNTSLVCRDISGKLRHLETSITCMDDHFALVVFRDVTNYLLKRKKEDLLDNRASKVEQMSSLGNLAASIAHDFNNILTIIKNTLKTMELSERSDSTSNDAVFTIKEAANKGTTLVQELMTYAGQTNTKMKRKSPSNIIMELNPLYKGIVRPGVTLEVNNTENLPDVMVDTDQFWKVFVNLVKNAAEAIKSSRGYIKISTYEYELTKTNAIKFFSNHPLEPDNGVIFEVADNGEGIPQSIVDRLFEPFFSTKAVGRGLGLATVFGIVDSHNGGISIISHENTGTTFQVWLPKATMEPKSDDLAELSKDTLEENPPTAASVTTATTLSKSAKPCVLIIDDDPSIIKTSALLLEIMGVETLTATTKNEAVARFRKHRGKINIVMLDAQLGNLDSVRLLAKLRMTNEAIPVIICSGYSREKVRKMFAESRIDGILIKPYTMSEIENVLSEFIALA